MKNQDIAYKIWLGVVAFMGVLVVISIAATMAIYFPDVVVGSIENANAIELANYAAQLENVRTIGENVMELTGILEAIMLVPLIGLAIGIFKTEERKEIRS